MATINGQITLDQLQLIEVNSDPSTGSGAATTLGSVAVLNSGSDAQLWLNYGSSATQWRRVLSMTDNSAFTLGSIPYINANGNTVQDPTNLFYDSTDKRIGVGTGSPLAKIHVKNALASDVSLILQLAASATGNVIAVDNSSGTPTAALTSALNWNVGQGTTSAPAYSFYADSGTGLWQPATGQIAMSLSGIQTLTLTSTGLGIGTTSPQNTVDIQSNGSTNVGYTSYGVGNYTSNFVRFARGTQASPSAVQSGDLLGDFSFRGYGATSFSSAGTARVRAIATQNWTDSAYGTALAFLSTANNSTTAVEAMRIDQSGFIGVNTTTPGSLLDVNGTLSFSSEAPYQTITTTSASTLTLTSASNSFQIFTGTTAGQVVQLPNATTIRAGFRFTFFNTSTTSIQVNDGSGATLMTMAPVSQLVLDLLTNSTAAGQWISANNFSSAQQSVTSTTTTSTTSHTAVAINSMSITPTTPGTYMVWFNTTYMNTSGTGVGATNTFSIYAGGTQVADSVRALGSNSDFYGNNQPGTVAIVTTVTVNGSQAIQAYFMTSANTLSVYQRSLTVLRVG